MRSSHNGWIALLLVVLMASGCGKANQQNGARRARPAKVVVAPTEKQTLIPYIKSVGSLEAKERVEIAAEVDGPVEGIAFEEGDIVAEGQLLFCVDKSVLTALVDQAVPDLNLAKRNLQRTKSLVLSRTATKQELDEAQQAFDTAKATLNLRRKQLERACVKAPFSGRLGKRLVSRGQFVSRGDMLVTLVDEAHIKANLNVTERDVSLVKLGQKVEITVAAFKGKTFQGKVSFISPELDAATRLLTLAVDIDNEQLELKAGMFCQAKIITGAKREALVIPDASLLIEGQDTRVVVIDQKGLANFRKVKVGKHLDGYVEVLSGLSLGEKVVIEGLQKVRAGANVDMAEAPRIGAKS